MQKVIGKIRFLAFTLMVILVLFASCSGGAGAENATISINLVKGSLPDKSSVSPDQLRHVIELSGPTGIQTLTLSGSGTAKATVAPGLWRIDVEAYLGDELYAKGSATADVKAGRNTNVTVFMTVVWGGEAGGGIGTGGGGGNPAGSGPVSPGFTGSIVITASGGINGDEKSLSGSWIEGQTLTAAYSGPETPTGWIWYDDSAAVISSINTYTITAADRGKLYSVEADFGSTTIQLGFDIHPWVPLNSPAAFYSMILSGEYILTCDIPSPGITPNNMGPFTGKLDGNGKKIFININEGGQNSGLFASISLGSEIKNLILEGQVVTTMGGAATNYAGSVAGQNNGTIRNVISKVDVSISNNVTIAGTSENAGGIAGINTGTITNCFHDANITTIGSVEIVRAGGIVGFNDTGGNISYCLSMGDITSTNNSALTYDRFVGGIAGNHAGNSINNNVVTGGVLDIQSGFPSWSLGPIANGSPVPITNYHYDTITYTKSLANTDGTSVTPPTPESWWQGIWTSVWAGTTPTETRPWVWDGSRPKLWFE